MTAVAPTSTFASPAPAIPAMAGGRPLIVKTDGEALILKRAFRHTNGKYYDLKIWKKDVDGSAIKIDENSQFLVSSLEEIQAISKAIFDRFLDPSISTVLYRKDPEACEYQNTQDHSYVDLIGGAERDPIADQAERIHDLLITEHSFEWARNPQAQLVIQPTRLPQDRVNPATQSSAAPANGAPTPNPGGATHSASSSGTSGATSGATSPAALQPQVVPIPEDFRLKRDQNIDQAGIDYAARNHGCDFLKDVKYTDLATYAGMSPAQRSSSSHHAKLKPVYEEFCKVLKDPTVSDGQSIQMKAWLRTLYEAAYLKYLELQTLFTANYASTFSGTFEEWCQYMAANVVVGFIKVPGVDMGPLVQFLNQPVIPLHNI